ncbi:MAG: hypothetical protein Q4A88_02150 [Clostridia bacterium]|nr:hypothetical protein [Clostridia bacterium]
MRDFWEKLKAYIRKSASVTVQIGQTTVSRLTFIGVALGILAAGIFVLVYMVYGNREVALRYERTDIDPGQSYRVNDGMLFYETPQYYVSIDPSKTNRVSLAEVRVTADGYDMSSAATVVFVGSSGQIVGPNGVQNEFVMNDGAEILSARAGRRHAALLYRNQYGDMRISIMNALTETPEVTATVAITGGEVVAFGFLQASNTVEYLWVSTLDVNQFSEESIVRVYNCDSNGAMIFYSASLYNQTIENAILTGNCLYLVGTQDILRYDRTEDGFSSERARVSIYGSRVVDCVEAADGASAYFILMPITQAGEQTHIYRLLTVSQSDEAWATVLQQFMSAPIVAAFLQNNYVNVVTTETFEQYSYAGKQALSLEFEDTPTGAIPYEGAFLLMTDTAVYRTTVE